MRQKGFTLLELLAVIVILAIVALITVPLIMNTIEDAKEGAYEESVRGAIATASMDAARSKFQYENYVVKDGGVYRDDTKIDMKGSISGTGIIVIRKEEGVKVSIQNGEICAYKDFKDEQVTYEKRTCPE